MIWRRELLSFPVKFPSQNTTTNWSFVPCARQAFSPPRSTKRYQRELGNKLWWTGILSRANTNSLSCLVPRKPDINTSRMSKICSGQTFCLFHQSNLSFSICIFPPSSLRSASSSNSLCQTIRLWRPLQFHNQDRLPNEDAVYEPFPEPHRRIRPASSAYSPNA